MGNKGIKLVKGLLVCIFAILVFSSGKVFANSVISNIHDTRFVKVAISNNSFQSIAYNQISIIATAEYYLYDKNSHKLLAKCSPDDVVKIKFESNKFNVIVNNKTILQNPISILVFDCPKGLLGVQNLKRNGKQAFYHGIFEITPKNLTQFYLINVLDLQSYLKGVVPNEMPVSFGIEALKAQTVAARNYVLMPRTKESREFDVDDSVSSQVYFGANSEKPLANQAVNDTQGLVALYGWNLILAQYSSTAGGYTENYENAFSEPRTKEFPARGKPYLKGKPDIYSVAPLNREEEARIYYMSYPDSYDIKSPYYRWKKEFNRDELEKTLSKTLIDQSKTGFVKPIFKQGDSLGELKELKVLKRGVSGKIIELEIVTDKGSWKVCKELVIRRLIQKNGTSLPSANVIFDPLYDTNKKLDKIIAYGGGLGHGVGMSQYGAGFMSTSLHKSFDKILKRYYTGITISTIPVILSPNVSQKVIAQEFVAPINKAILVVDNMYNIKEFNASINGRNVAFDLSNKIVPIHRVSRIDISSYLKSGKNTIVFYFPENEKTKAIRLYIEVIEKDESEYNF